MDKDKFILVCDSLRAMNQLAAVVCAQKISDLYILSAEKFQQQYPVASKQLAFVVNMPPITAEQNPLINLQWLIEANISQHEAAEILMDLANSYN